MNQTDAQSISEPTRPDSAISETTADKATISLSDIIRILRSGGAALFAQVGLHGQLARVEWAQERQRFTQLLVITLLGFACLLCLLLTLGAILLALFWDTPLRFVVVVSLLLFYGLGTWLAWHRFVQVSARSEQAFAGTREELAADIALLRSKL